VYSEKPIYRKERRGGKNDKLIIDKNSIKFASNQGNYEE